jgi:hypothetical protein
VGYERVHFPVKNYFTNAKQILLFASQLFLAGAAHAQSFGLESAGARVGASPGNAHNFHQAEGFLNFNLPWKWDLGKGWALQTRLDLSAGWLADPGADAALGTLGPAFLLRRSGFPLSFEIGASPTLISEHEFQTKNLGADLQFTSHAGLNFDWGHVRIGYRFQHMSNGDLAEPNPGLNLHVLSLSYLF